MTRHYDTNWTPARIAAWNEAGLELGDTEIGTVSDDFDSTPMGQALASSYAEAERMRREGRA